MPQNSSSLDLFRASAQVGHSGPPSPSGSISSQETAPGGLEAQIAEFMQRRTSFNLEWVKKRPNGPRPPVLLTTVMVLFKIFFCMQIKFYFILCYEIFNIYKVENLELLISIFITKKYDELTLFFIVLTLGFVAVRKRRRRKRLQSSLRKNFFRWQLRLWQKLLGTHSSRRGESR